MAEVRTSPLAKQAWRASRRRLFRRTLSPPPNLKVDEWADAHRHLSRENSAEPGLWRTERTPYLRPIMRWLTDPAVEEIVVMKAARVGYTEGVIANAIGYVIDQDPSPMLVVQPTVEDAEGWSKDSLTPLIEESPRLKGKVSDQKSRASSNTILAKRFAGGSIRAIGANSPRGFRRITVRWVFFDEIDGYDVGGAGSEGDQISLGKKRALSYDNRKFVLGSTPTIKGVSRVEKSYNASSMGRWYVPCPHCGHMQPLVWANIGWDKTTREDGTVEHHPETAHYACASCGVVIDERHKPAMVRAGTDVHAHPGRRVKGMHLSALYSLFHGARWEVLVREFLEAKDFPELLQVWTNTVLGETWEEQGSGINADTLSARCEVYAAEVPSAVGLLTAAADVQDDRIEMKVKGWGAAQESWLIDHQVFWGDPGQPEVWAALDNAWRKRYLHESGLALPIKVLAVDTGGHHTESVYNWVKPRQKRGVYAIAGSKSKTAEIWPKHTAKAKTAGVKLFQIGVYAAKDLIFSRLRRAVPGPTFMHFPTPTPEEYFSQLTAEKKIPEVNKKSGRVEYVYKKTRPRNEALDLEVYCLAALYSLGRVVYEHLDRIVARVQREGAELLAQRLAEQLAKVLPANVLPKPATAAKRARKPGFAKRW